MFHVTIYEFIVLVYMFQICVHLECFLFGVLIRICYYFSHTLRYSRASSQIYSVLLIMRETAFQHCLTDILVGSTYNSNT